MSPNPTVSLTSYRGDDLLFDGDALVRNVKSVNFAPRRGSMVEAAPERNEVRTVNYVKLSGARALRPSRAA